MKFFDLFKLRQKPTREAAVPEAVSPLRGPVLALRRLDRDAFRQAWHEVGRDIDSELRLMNMRWENHEIGLHFGRDGAGLHRTDLAKLTSAVKYRLRFPRRGLEVSCYALRRELTLRRMGSAMRAEARKRWALLDRVVKDEPHSLRPWGPYGARMRQLLEYAPYGHEMPTFERAA